MQLVASGPELPDALLQAHEDSRAVFFCGAGISFPAGLPSFKGLVDDIYHRVGTMRTAIEQAAYEHNQFDATLDLLERRLPGQRLAVRHVLFEVLQPKLRRKGAADTHTALLQLARSREGALRLVTTNFDRIFARLMARTKADSSDQLKKLVEWELVLADDHVHSCLRQLAEDEHWRGALPLLLDDFQQLLRDALDLLGELGEADYRSDHSHWALPSISPHWQNRGFRDWVALIELLRDAWLRVRDIDPARAIRIAHAWFTLPYSTFKRLTSNPSSANCAIPAWRSSVMVACC